MKLFRTLITIYFLTVFVAVQSQYVPAQIDKTLQQFLSELESEHFIEHYNQSAYRYSEKQIYQILQEAELNLRSQNSRQKKEIGFYLRQFRTANEYNRWEEHDVDIIRSGNTFSLSLNPPGMFVRGDYSGLSITPIMGVLGTITNRNKSLNRHLGARFSGNGGPFGFYASYQRNFKSSYTYQKLVNERIPAQGFSYMHSNEVKFGLSFSVPIITAALTFDNQLLLPHTQQSITIWTKTPAYPSFNISVSPIKWLSYQFRTGYIINSPTNNSFETYLENSHTNHYFAHNQLLLNPIRQVEFTLGQTAFTTQNRLKANYLLPINAYVSGEPNENTFFFYRIKIASIKHLNVAFSQTFDDFTFKRAKSEYDRNVQSYALDASLTNWPLQNLIINYNYSVHYPLYLNHEQTPIYNLWPSLNMLTIGNKNMHTVSIRAKPTHHLLINIGYQLEQIGQQQNYDNQFPYDFEIIDPIERRTNIFSFEFIVKPAYNTSFFAGLHYINHNGEDPSYRLQEYSKEANYIFRIGFNVGL